MIGVDERPPVQLARATDPAALPLLTVLVHPEHDPRARDAIRYMRTGRQLAPWVPISGQYATQLAALDHPRVWGWLVQTFPDVVAALTRKGTP